MFDCKATSDLGIKYFWFQRAKGSSSVTSVLKLDKRFIIFQNGSLEIRSAQKKDEAFYHCRAENPIGYNNVTAFMRVLGMYALKELRHDILSCFLDRLKFSFIGGKPLNNSFPE